MKKLIVLLIGIIVFSSLYAKDISLKFENKLNMEVTVYTGLITSKDNHYSDEELIQYKSDFGFTTLSRPIKAKKKGQSMVKEAKGSQILVVFGLYTGGGRTEVFRYKVRDIKAPLTIIFQSVPVYEPSMTYYNVAKGLLSTGDAGQSISVGNVQVTGNFVFYDIVTENLNDLYVMRPNEKIPYEREGGEDNEVGDFLYKDAKPVYVNAKGKISLTITETPETPDDVFNEVVIPAIEKMPSIFGSTEYKFLTWNIINSGKVVNKPIEKSFTKLINACREFDKRAVFERYTRDILMNGKSDFHLYLITSAQRIDSLFITESEIEPLQETDLIKEEDLITPKGNYRFTGKEKTVYQQAFAIKDLNAIDLTPLLQYKVLTEGQFGKSESAAVNLLELYSELGNYIELPALSEDVMSISKPAYTITTIQQTLVSSGLLEKIEAKLNQDQALPIPITISIALKTKLEKGR